MSRNYAALLHEYLEEMAELDDAEFGRLVRALLKYSMTGEVAELPGNERYYYRHVINQENRHQESYENIAARNRENGKKGGRPKNPEEPSETQKTQTNTNTKTKTDTKTKTKNNALSSKDEKSGAAARMRKDMAALEALRREERDGDEQAQSGLVGVRQAHDPAIPRPGQ